MRKTKIIQHYLAKTISDRSSSFSVENRGGGKWLCYTERDSIIAEIPISKKSFHALMRFTNGVTCQKWVDEDSGDMVDEVKEALVDMVTSHVKNGGRKMHTSFIRDPPKKEMNPFITQIFEPLS
jgi:hypothetical protein